MHVRFSIKVMMLAPVFVGAACTALFYPSVVLSGCYFVVSLLLVLTGVVGTIIRHGRMRAYWLGFALFGGGYFCLATINERYVMNSSNGVLVSPLPTTNLVMWVYGKNVGPATSQPAFVTTSNGRIATSGTTRNNAVMLNAEAGQYVVSCGHSVFTVLFAIFGGWIGSWFAALDRRSGAATGLAPSGPSS